VRICPSSTDGKHHYYVNKGFMICEVCYTTQVVCDNHGPNWVKVKK